MPPSNKLNFLLSSKQFIKHMKIPIPLNNNYNKNTYSYFGELENQNDKDEKSRKDLAENHFLHSVLRDKNKVDVFQTFLDSMCMKLNIPFIMLRDLNLTCETSERQLILLILLHYYFVNDDL